MSTDVVILIARRSAIGRLMGGLSELPAVEMGVQLARATLSAAGVDAAKSALACPWTGPASPSIRSAAAA